MRAKGVSAIPGAEATCGIGDPLRVLRLMAADSFSGAHTNNASYFDRPQLTPQVLERTFERTLADLALTTDVESKALRLKTVCWLAVGGTIDSVPPGRYEAVLRLRLTRSEPNFVGDWRIGVGVHAKRDWEKKLVDDVGALHLRNDHGKGKGGKCLSALPKDRFSALSFGVLQLEEKANVRFELGGGNPYWCDGLELLCFELRKVKPPWAVLRQLFLGNDPARQPGPSDEEPGCQLAKLPREVLRVVIDLL